MVTTQPIQHASARMKWAAIRLTLIVVVLLGALWVFQWMRALAALPTQIRTTQATMRIVEAAIKARKAEKGSFPVSLRTLVTERYFDRDRFDDAWRHELRYAIPGDDGKEYAFVSAGPDGAFGTTDDIDVWKIGN